MRNIFCIGLFITSLALCSVNIYAAQPLKKVTGEYTFYAESHHSRDEARRIALDEARINALAGEFGTNVSQATYQADISSRDFEDIYFNQLSLCEVNGEWIADEGAPVFEEKFGPDNNLIVRCIVKGTARRISNEAPQFEAKVLRNGNEERFADTRFRPGDEMKLYVRTPVNGYLVVYLVDDEQNVFSILPYRDNGDGYIKINRDTDYVFFDATKADQRFGEPDELVITLPEGKHTEVDQCYILFSPEPFTKALDMAAVGSLPRSLSYDAFQNWLVRSRKRDPKMAMKVIRMLINSKL